MRPSSHPPGFCGLLPGTEVYIELAPKEAALRSATAVEPARVSSFTRATWRRPPGHLRVKIGGASASGPWPHALTGALPPPSRVGKLFLCAEPSGGREPDDTAEPDVRGGRLDHLRLARGRTVAQAIVRCAEMRAALGDSPRDRLARLSHVETLFRRFHPWLRGAQHGRAASSG
jgi:hypothetical protein